MIKSVDFETRRCAHDEGSASHASPKIETTTLYTVDVYCVDSVAVLSNEMELFSCDVYVNNEISSYFTTEIK